MIIINAVLENNTIRPERTLTTDEQKTVSSMICNGINYIYYQFDEPIEEFPIEEFE